MKSISIKNSLPYLKCVLKCLWPVYGLGCAKEIDLSLKRQAVNAVIFVAALMVGMSFVMTLLTGIKKTNDDDDVDDDDFEEEGDN